MTFLLDTHTLIWFLSGDTRLPVHLRALIEEDRNEIFVSVASLWEMAIKISAGKLEMGRPFEELFLSTGAQRH